MQGAKTMSGLGLSSSPSLDPLPSVSAAAQAETTAALHKGANWLFLIGGLSVVNTVTLISGSQWLFLGGLGVTELAAAIAMHLGTKGQLIGLFINLWATAFFVVLGFFARKGQKWAFITGMALYAGRRFGRSIPSAMDHDSFPWLRLFPSLSGVLKLQ
jgi:hypothetical protein